MKDKLSLMNTKKIKQFYDKYYIADWIEIGFNFLFFVVSLIPALKAKEGHQISVALFFLVVTLAEMFLFFWNLRAKKRGCLIRTQAAMLIVAGDILLLMHTLSIIAIMYEMGLKDETPLMASNLVFAIAYGIFAILRLVIGVIRVVKSEKKDAYQMALSGFMLVCLVYTFALFVDYMLIVNKAADLRWPGYIMIALMGATTISLAIWMQVRAIRFLKHGWTEEHNHEPDAG